MIEMLKNKSLIAFVCIMLGIVFINIPGTRLDSEDIPHEEYVYNDVK